MFIFTFLSEIILNSFIVYIALFISKLSENLNIDNESLTTQINIDSKESVSLVQENKLSQVDKMTALPTYSWAGNTVTIDIGAELISSIPKIKSDVQRLIITNSKNINIDNTLIILYAFALFILSPFILNIVKIKFSFLFFISIILSIIAFYIYSYKYKIIPVNISELQSNYKYFFSNIYIQCVNFIKNKEYMNMKNILKETSASFKAQNKFNIIFAICLFIFVYLDLFIAKISLDTQSATTYIFISIFCKTFIIISYLAIKRFILNNTKILENILKKLNIILNINIFNVIFAYIFYIFIFYTFFNFSKIIVNIISLDLFTSLHTSLPYIFISSLLSFSVLIFLTLEKDYLNKNADIVKVALYAIFFILISIVFMISIFYTNSLETVSFFISGISLMLLTLFYHLFYRLNIYIQMA